jgi:hypothetical protein
MNLGRMIKLGLVLTLVARYVSYEAKFTVRVSRPLVNMQVKISTIVFIFSRQWRSNSGHAYVLTCMLHRHCKNE